MRPIEDGDEDIDELGEGAKEWVERERRRGETEKEAEVWRMMGGFKRGELNVTRLGEWTGETILESANPGFVVLGSTGSPDVSDLYLHISFRSKHRGNRKTSSFSFRLARIGFARRRYSFRL